MSEESSTKHSVLIIDDDLAVLDQLNEILNQDYQVVSVNNEQEAIQSLDVNQPDLIILDMDPGNSNGIETAKRIKQDIDHSDIPIIFISNLTSKNDRMSCYEAGACDFISKTFSNEEVLHKVRMHLKYYLALQEKNKNIAETQQMVFTTMAQSGEIGSVMHFIRDSFECDSYEKIAHRILEYMSDQQLNIAILVKSNPFLYFSHENEVARLDKEILERLHILERIIDFGKRSIYNFEHISILIKNMPTDNPDNYGRIKDNVCLILEAADAKVSAINNEEVLTKHHKSIENVIDTSKITLKEIETSFQDNARKNEAIMRELKDKIEWSFVQLGLSEEQETEIANIVDDVEKDSTALYNSGLQIEERLTELADKFSTLTNTQSR